MKNNPILPEVFLTQYALTTGIIRVTGAEQCLPSVPGEELIKVTSMQYAHKNEWFLTQDEAVARANEMRTKRIASLEKQIEKLKKQAKAPWKIVDRKAFA